MSDQTPIVQAYTLWFETARLVVAPDAGQFRVTLYWNREEHSERAFTTQDEAEAWGYELHTIVMRDALAGALLGYDADVVTRLTDAVSG